MFVFLFEKPVKMILAHLTWDEKVRLMKLTIAIAASTVIYTYGVGTGIVIAMVAHSLS